MKIEVEVLDGVLVIENEEGTMKMVVDVPTAEIILLEYTEATVHTLAKFVTRAKSRYSKFLNSEDAETFLD